jgi:hypothetical protein
MVQNAQRLQQVLLLKVRKDLEKDRVEMTGCHGIEEYADAIVICEVFEKKTNRTPKNIIDVCQQRLKRYDTDGA